jgi:hypothetical protein
MSDAPKVKVHLDGEFSASELEGIIHRLAQARASLLPAVPRDPPSIASDAEALVQEEAEFRVRTLADGGLRIWLRNEGLGWIAFTVSRRDRDSLAEFLSKKIGHSHKSH